MSLIHRLIVRFVACLLLVSVLGCASSTPQWQPDSELSDAGLKGVAYLSESRGLSLDGSLASLDRLDADLMSVGPLQSQDAVAAFDIANMIYGLYVGDVIRQKSGGQWLRNTAKRERGSADLLVLETPAGQRYDTVQWVKDRLMHRGPTLRERVEAATASSGI